MDEDLKRLLAAEVRWFDRHPYERPRKFLDIARQIDGKKKGMYQQMIKTHPENLPLLIAFVSELSLEYELEGNGSHCSHGVSLPDELTSLLSRKRNARVSQVLSDFHKSIDRDLERYFERDHDDII